MTDPSPESMPVDREAAHFPALVTEIERQATEIERLREAPGTVVAQSLLDVRRACFAPEIGTRMTERWRSDMADACRRLEDLARAALNEKEPDAARPH